MIQCSQHVRVTFILAASTSAYAYVNLTKSYNSAQKLSLALRMAANASTSAASAEILSVLRMSGSCGLRNGFVSSSCCSVLGMVASP